MRGFGPLNNLSRRLFNIDDITTQIFFSFFLGQIRFFFLIRHIHDPKFVLTTGGRDLERERPFDNGLIVFGLRIKIIKGNRGDLFDVLRAEDDHLLEDLFAVFFLDLRVINLKLLIFFKGRKFNAFKIPRSPHPHPRRNRIPHLHFLRAYRDIKIK